MPKGGEPYCIISLHSVLVRIMQKALFSSYGSESWLRGVSVLRGPGSLFYVCRYSILNICSLTDPVSLQSVGRVETEIYLFSFRSNVPIQSCSPCWESFPFSSLGTELLPSSWCMPTQEQRLGLSCHHGFAWCSQRWQYKLMVWSQQTMGSKGLPLCCSLQEPCRKAVWWEARYGHCGRDMTDVVIRSESCVSLLSSCFLMTFFPLMISYPFPKKIQGGMQLRFQDLI